MRRHITLIGLLLAIAPLAPCQDFQFDLGNRSTIVEGEVFEVGVRLTSSGIEAGEPGPEGWQLSVGHEGVDLLSVTTENTALDDFFDKGFERTQITTGDGNAGFISAAVLSLESGITLPPNSTEFIARAIYYAPLLCQGGGKIELKDGLDGGGFPSQNTVSWKGLSFLPEDRALDFSSCNEHERRLSLETDNVEIDVSARTKNSVAVSVWLEQQAATTNAFSLAVSHDSGDLDLIRATLQGGDIEDLITESGFVLIETTQGPGNEGLVVQGQLSNQREGVIPAGRQRLLSIEYQVARIPDHGQEYSTSIAFADSLRGSGGTSRNSVTPAGTLDIANPLELQIRRSPVILLTRGDVNGDHAVDIGDPIAGLFNLFLGEGRICHDAGDTNADSTFDLSDIVYTLNYLFLGGPQPASPFPTCGESERILGCDLPDCAI